MMNGMNNMMGPLMGLMMTYWVVFSVVLLAVLVLLAVWLFQSGPRIWRQRSTRTECVAGPCGAFRSR